MEPCRKCQTPNPSTNQFCRKCGAVLAVSTALVSAQRKPVEVMREHFQFRWVVIGVFVMIGLVSIATTALFLLLPMLMEVELKTMPLAMATTLLFCFWFGGFVISRLAASRRSVEPALAAVAVLALLGSVGMVLTDDLLWIILILALPSVFLAGLGGWLGGLFRREKGN